MELIFDRWDDVMVLDILDWLYSHGHIVASDCVRVETSKLVIKFDSVELYAEAVLRWK